MKNWIFEISDYQGIYISEVPAVRYRTALHRIGELIEKTAKKNGELLTQYEIRLKKIKNLRTI